MTKYDIIIGGGGPAGLMAARTAARAGLKVLLLEKRHDISRIRRSCLQVLYLSWISWDAYIEQITVEVSSSGATINFPGPGFSVDYRGTLTPYRNAIFLSPGGVRAYPIKDKLFGFYYDKSVLVAGLLTEAGTAGAEIRSGATVLNARDDGQSVTVRYSDDTGEHDVTARRLIAADGVNSRIASGLGINADRKIFVPKMKGVGYVMDNVKPDIPGQESAWVSINIPSIGSGRIGIGLWDGNLRYVGPDFNDAIAAFPRYAHWFADALVVDKRGFSATICTPLREPIHGNVLVLGDAAAPIETWIQGAMACGYQAVQAIMREDNNQPGFDWYTRWWQRAFFFNDPWYFRKRAAHTLFNMICSDEELDYVYGLFPNKRVLPTLELVRQPDVIKKDRPELHAKIIQGLKKQSAWLAPIISGFPPEAEIFKDRDVYLGPWQPYRVS
jgi:digeranylgeranylglycerophospholipid reductase